MDLIGTVQDPEKSQSFVIRKITHNFSMIAILKLSKSGLSASAIKFLPSRNWKCIPQENNFNYSNRFNPEIQYSFKNLRGSVGSL